MLHAYVTFQLDVTHPQVGKVDLVWVHQVFWIWLRGPHQRSSQMFCGSVWRHQLIQNILQRL